MEHHGRSSNQSKLSVFSFDCFFLSEKWKFVKRDEEENVDILVKTLVAIDSRCRCVFGHVVLQKAIDIDNYAADTLIEDVKWLGFQRIIWKSDNEPAIVKCLSSALTE